MITQHQVELEGLNVSARCSRLTVFEVPREKKEEGGTAWLRLRHRGAEGRGEGGREVVSRG